MLARCSVLLSSRRAAASMMGPLATASRFSANSNTLRPSSLIAQSNNNSMVKCNAMAVQRRNYVGEALAGNLLVHATQVGACTSLATVLYSPLGTAMLIVLAYNVVVICTKHVNYSMEITAKDYVQDQQLYVIMRYGILSCILLGMEVLFVEI